MNSEYDLVVIGSGPAGYVGAIRAAQIGFKVAVVEAEAIGGVCANWGCIPSKAILHCAEVYDLARARSGRADCGIRAEAFTFDYSAIVEKSQHAAQRLSRGIESLFRKNKIEVIRGVGRLADSQTVLVRPSAENPAERPVRTQRILLATGSRPRLLPGLEADGQRILTSRHALALREVPRSLLIVGAGAVGLEFASVFASYGSQVTIVEREQYAPPMADHDAAAELLRCLQRRGIRILLGATCREVKATEASVEVVASCGDKEERLRGDRMLVAISVLPNSENLGLELLDIAPAKGLVQVGPGFRTACPTVWAAGDLIGPPMLAHAASAEAIAAVEAMAGVGDGVVNYRAIPACIYCQPELAMIGLTEKQARAEASDIGVVKVPFVANGKAVATGQTDGLIKLVFDRQSHAILGCHIVGHQITELVNQMSLAMSAGLTLDQVAHAVYAHPTRSELVGEAALAALGRSISV